MKNNLFQVQEEFQQYCQFHSFVNMHAIEVKYSNLTVGK